MANDESKQMTRVEAEALVHAKYGNGVVSFGMVHGYRVGRMVNGHFQILGHSALSWRDACERAGLLPAGEPNNG